MEVDAKETVGKKYLIPGYLENTACTCIKELVNKNSSLDDPIVKYLLGYSDYIPKNTMYKRIGKTFQEINELFRFLWKPLF